MRKRMFWCLEIQIQKKGHTDKTDAVHLSKMTIFSGRAYGYRYPKFIYYFLAGPYSQFNKEKSIVQHDYLESIKFIKII